MRKDRRHHLARHLSAQQPVAVLGEHSRHPDGVVNAQGNTHTEAARRLCVSIKFVNDMVRLKRETGSLAPRPQGNPGRGKLTGVKGWVDRRIAERPDLTIDDLTMELGAEHGLKVHRSTVGRLLHRLGLSHKKRPSGA